MKIRTSIALLIVAVSLPAWSQNQAQPQYQEIAAVYQQILSGMRSAKTKQDVVKLMDATDTADWISIDALGKRSTRAEAQKAMETLVATPPEKRVLPDIEVVWIREAGGKATVLMWVSLQARITDHQGQFGEKGKTHSTAVGALVRDSLTLTPKGWRRTMHEKLFPDQPLSIDGAPRIHIPGTPQLTQARK